MKFSEGKSITRKDVEEQWQREEALLSDMFHKYMEYGEPRKSFTVDCKMYDLPEGCEVTNFVLSVKSWAAICGCKVDMQSKTNAPKVLLKDCPFVQQAKTIGQICFDYEEKCSFAGIWEQLHGEFCLTPGNVYGEMPKSRLSIFESDVRYYFKKHVRKEFSKLLHHGAKHNAVRHIKALAKDNAVRCIADLKEKLKKLEGKLEKVSEKEKLKK